MKILANRVHPQYEEPSVHTYQIIKGGGIIKKGGRIVVTQHPDADAPENSLPRYSEPVPVNFKSTHTNFRAGIALGTMCSSTIPILSEGVGIPKIFEIRLFGQAKFRGRFDEHSLVLESKGITNPNIETRKSAMKKFSQGIAAINSNVKAIQCELKDDNFALFAGLSYSFVNTKTTPGF